MQGGNALEEKERENHQLKLEVEELTTNIDTLQDRFNTLDGKHKCEIGPADVVDKMSNEVSNRQAAVNSAINQLQLSINQA